MHDPIVHVLRRCDAQPLTYVRTGCAKKKSEHRTSYCVAACHVPDRSQLTKEEEQRDALYFCTLSPEHRCIPCSHNVKPHLSAICYGCQPVQLQQMSISYGSAECAFHTAKEREPVS